MAGKRLEGDWSEVAIAMDRGLRVFAEFVKPILAAHAADNLSLTNVIFLMSVGEGEARVNDIVRSGRYIGSNASYALKALHGAGLIDRRQDEQDRRNAVVRWTERGQSLASALRRACASPAGVPGGASDVLSAFETHCAKQPGA